jgi:asparaginyl-tRNA synthetase
LAPGIGEIIGGNQREERLDVLDRSMAERGIDREHYAPTLPSPASGGGLGRGICGDLRRYGTVPHAGFGLGFERTLAYVTGLANVRDAIPFPRTPGNARYRRLVPQRSRLHRPPRSSSLSENSDDTRRE